LARATGEAAGLRARLDTAADDYADGKIDARQLERITARIRPALDAAENGRGSWMTTRCWKVW